MITKRKIKQAVIVTFTVLWLIQLLHITGYLIKYTLIKEKNELAEVETKKINDKDYDIDEERYIQNDDIEQRPGDYHKYILLVTKKPSIYPFSMFTPGSTVFRKNNCDFTNCYITDDRNYRSEASFDLVAFNSIDIQEMDIPRHRSPHQIYAFFSFESPHYYPVCADIYDDFFNWTFTYKLNSDFRWWFFDIYDMNETKIGPPVHVWPNFKPIDDDIKFKLDSKTRMAAWFVSNCDTISGREWVALELDKELRERYGWSIDVYGNCGKYACPRRYADLCHYQIEEKYFFYLALENSFAEDYITEKVLHGLNNFAIPVVYGAANYSRFLPPGSYLDAKELGTQELARVMNKIVTHPQILYDYFKWTNHLSYRHIRKGSQVCELCAILNDKKRMKTKIMYPNFRKWWNNDGWDESCLQSHDYF